MTDEQKFAAMEACMAGESPTQTGLRPKEEALAERLRKQFERASTPEEGWRHIARVALRMEYSAVEAERERCRGIVRSAWARIEDMLP